MLTDWSDTIVVADLEDEPALSDALAAMIDRASSIEAKAVPHVVLNMAEVTYLNSSNIAQLLTLRKRLKECERRVTLCAVNDEVWTVMLATGLDKVFTFAPDTMTALASLQIEDAD